LRHLDAAPGVGLAGPLVLGGDGLLQRSCRGFPTLWNMLCRALGLDTAFGRHRLFSGYAMTWWPQRDTRPVDILSGCFWAVRRRAYEDVGGLDEAFFIYGEDMDWCRRFWRAGWALAFVSTVRAIHYGGGSSRNAPVRFFLEKQKADLQYWRKHHGAAAAFAFRLVSIVHMLLRVAGFSLRRRLGRGDASASRYRVERSIACLKLLWRPAKRPVLPS